jgi:hypothetical protein
MALRTEKRPLCSLNLQNQAKNILYGKNYIRSYDQLWLLPIIVIPAKTGTMTSGGPTGASVSTPSG